MHVVVGSAQLTLEALPLLPVVGLMTACLALHGRGDKWVPRLGGAPFGCSHDKLPCE